MASSSLPLAVVLLLLVSACSSQALPGYRVLPHRFLEAGSDSDNSRSSGALKKNLREMLSSVVSSPPPHKSPHKQHSSPPPACPPPPPTPPPTPVAPTSI
ncbi:uncharacterized protein [Physcomitrium patens]|uniref:Uncharacterized protein n=1 Tax=Physcomitrium patens TaxID=3218 RepID=A0A2K1L417_PHYPA|nr:myb-related transcription factor, partner of profilin-like [Physcomitrium patens]PNR60761.1 hypothetical protein PHYPA_003554 [Physcomitrium patens]|eukprot:XP_024368642.1 myb-related transcription factor, partner of profilin-like [Physcomitrella patens]